MILQKPKVKFVPIDKNVFTQQASGCPDYETQIPVGGGQRCIGSQIDAHDCENWDEEYPWLD